MLHIDESTSQSIVPLDIPCIVWSRNHSTLAGNRQCIQFLSKAVCLHHTHKHEFLYCMLFHSHTLRILLMFCCSNCNLDRTHTCLPRKLEPRLDNQYSCELKDHKFGSSDSSCITMTLSRNILDGSSLCTCNRSRTSQVGICMILTPYQNTSLQDNSHILEQIYCKIDFQGMKRISIHQK